MRYAAEHSTLPWFAIGGIDGQNLPEVIGAGAQRVAIVRAIMKAKDPAQAAQRILVQLNATEH